MVGSPPPPRPSACLARQDPAEGLEGDLGPTDSSRGRPQGPWKAPCPQGTPEALRSLASRWPRQAGLWGLTGDRERRSWPERRGAVGILNHACSRQTHPSHHGGWAPRAGNSKGRDPGPPLRPSRLSRRADHHPAVSLVGRQRRTLGPKAMQPRPLRTWEGAGLWWEGPGRPPHWERRLREGVPRPGPGERHRAPIMGVHGTFPPLRAVRIPLMEEEIPAPETEKLCPRRC